MCVCSEPAIRAQDEPLSCCFGMAAKERQKRNNVLGLSERKLLSLCLVNNVAENLLLERALPNGLGICTESALWIRLCWSTDQFFTRNLYSSRFLKA